MKIARLKKSAHTNWSRFIVELCLFGMILGILLFQINAWYRQLAWSPDPREGNQVTELPPYLKNVLGAKTYGPDQEPNIRLPIFMYHYVEYVKDKRDTMRQSLSTPPHVLTAQIDTLKAAGYTFVTPSYLTKILQRKRPAREKLIMLTFDDGYEDFYTDVFPILEKERIPATAYIVPNFLDRPNYMTTKQLKEISQSPWVEIGAHTMDHLWLKGLGFHQAFYQIAHSRSVLQDMLQMPVTSFAYPYGAFDQQAEEITARVGFDTAVSTVPGISHSPETQYYLYRLRPGWRTGETLVKYLEQIKFAPW